MVDFFWFPDEHCLRIEPLKTRAGCLGRRPQRYVGYCPWLEERGPMGLLSRACLWTEEDTLHRFRREGYGAAIGSFCPDRKGRVGTIPIR